MNQTAHPASGPSSPNLLHTDGRRQKGILTKEMEAVARQERFDPKRLMGLVAEGKIAIPANRLHTCLHPNGIGSMLRTKINVNLGTSRDCVDLDMELQKVSDAVAMGAESIMDLSSFGDTRKFRRKLTAECPAIIGTVPIYDAVVYYHKPLGQITADEWIDIVRMHAMDGVDFLTIHVGINKNTASRFKQAKRLTNIVSRGGSIIFAWMEMTGEENPFYARFDEILDICREYDVTLSLGDACRPGCLEDASDISQIEELVTLAELTRRAWEKDVQVIIEGPGHMPLDQIAANMKIQQTLCKGAPFYVLGPLVTDVAPGYDHITAAIRRSSRAAAGASFLLLRHSGRAFTAAGSGRRKRGNYRVANRSPRRRHCEGNSWRLRLGSKHERGPQKAGLGRNVPPLYRSGESQTLPRFLQAGKRRYLLHVRKFLRCQKYEPDPGWGNCLYF